jgi:hypothetical protein
LVQQVLQEFHKAVAHQEQQAVLVAHHQYLL